MPPRIVSYLCLFQVLGLIGAYLFASWLLKHHEKWDGAWVLSTNWGEWMSRVRSWIVLLLLIPAGTAGVSMHLSKTHRDIAFLGKDGLWLAIILTAAVLWFSATIILSAMSGPPQKVKMIDWLR